LQRRQATVENRSAGLRHFPTRMPGDAARFARRRPGSDRAARRQHAQRILSRRSASSRRMARASPRPRIVHPRLDCLNTAAEAARIRSLSRAMQNAHLVPAGSGG
jgi:hypothetical protein